jgi:hypothetical protein
MEIKITEEYRPDLGKTLYRVKRKVFWIFWETCYNGWSDIFDTRQEAEEVKRHYLNAK